MQKIDAHSHIGYFGSWCDVGITADEMVEKMDQFEIEKSIISYPDNELVRKAVEAFPDRLIGIPWVNPNQGEKAVKEAYHYVKECGFKGIKLHPLVDAFVANDESVFPVAKAAEALNVPLFIHSGHPPYSLPWSIAQLAEEFPRVKIVMVHMGHGHGVYIQAAIDMAKKFPNIYLETSGMPMHTKIKEAYEQVGHKRVFWGSDIPFHDYSVEIQRTMVSGLTDRQLEDVFYNNIQDLLMEAGY